MLLRSSLSSLCLRRAGKGCLQRNAPPQRRSLGGSGPWHKYNIQPLGEGSKVAVVGAAGGVGQLISMLLLSNMKGGGLPGCVALHDLSSRGLEGIASELESCCGTPTALECHVGEEELWEALEDANIVVIAASAAPGCESAESPRRSADIMESVAEICASACPSAWFVIVSSPLHITVPIFAHALHRAASASHVKPSNKVIGVTSMDVARSRCAVNRQQSLSVQTDVNVVGGGGRQAVPAFSQVADVFLTPSEAEELTAVVQGRLEMDVLEGSSEEQADARKLSAAVACARFVGKILRVINGKSSEDRQTAAEEEADDYSSFQSCAFVQYDSKALKSPFSSQLCTFGKSGILEIHPIENLSPYEMQALSTVDEQMEQEYAAVLNRHL